MAGLSFGRVMQGTALLVLLSACVPGETPFSASPGSTEAEAAGETETATGAAKPGATFALVEQDVEAPDVFSLKDKGLWDGRPSLGGVWVAHASVKDPERVIIRNPANGKSVIGALFRREVENPGPSLQVSSDAAAALGMLAGQPAALDVVALRREKPEPEVAVAAAAEVVVEEPAAAANTAPAAANTAPADPAPEPAAGADAIAVTAAAAIDRAEGKEDTAAATDGAAVPDAGTEATGEVAEVAVEKPCPFWRKKKCEAERAAIATDAADLSAATGEAATVAAGGIVVTAEPVPETATVVATPAAAGTFKSPYIQIGIFSVQANAQRAADQMGAAGMTATVKSDSSQGKQFWRVIIGPAASASERDALAARVKGMGYPDAYAVSR